MAHSLRIFDLLIAAALLLGAVLLTQLLSREGALRGYARAVDGDTLELLGERVRLQGLDAPELHQSCQRDARDGGAGSVAMSAGMSAGMSAAMSAAMSWPCGRVARDVLQGLLQKGVADCAFRARDRFGRPLARCTVGGRDLGTLLVRAGWAIAYGEQAYMAPEAAARRSRRGIWAGRFQTPRDYRATHPR